MKKPAATIHKKIKIIKTLLDVLESLPYIPRHYGGRLENPSGKVGMGNIQKNKVWFTIY
ncbi:MAG: hypothetical protein ACRBCK_03600 [Alphaproteobacteria bacterium]